MTEAIPTAHRAVKARLSRFARCVAPRHSTFVDSIQRISLGCHVRPGGVARHAYRDLLHEMSGFHDDPDTRRRPLIWSTAARFSNLPYHQRVAFALVVIEEFSVEDTADIMELALDDVRTLLAASRDALFAAARVSRSSDA